MFMMHLLFYWQSIKSFNELKQFKIIIKIFFLHTQSQMGEMIMSSLQDSVQMLCIFSVIFFRVVRVFHG